MDRCPNCKISWLSPNTISEDLFATGKYDTMEEATETAMKFWGSADRHFGANCVYVTQYSEDYSSKEKYWKCTSCGYEVRLGRGE